MVRTRTASWSAFLVGLIAGPIAMLMVVVLDALAPEAWPDPDARDFVPALDAAFERLEAAEGSIATPAVATWPGLQPSEVFDRW
jgi:hypothetical protein